MRLSAIAAALVAAIIGFGGTVAIVLSAADALGATDAQKASWVTAMCLALAAETLVLSLRHKMPIVTAWSTPGAAVLAASVGFDMASAVGAFILAAIAIILTGMFTPLMRLVSGIPASVSSSMLAGILAGFAIKGAQTAGLDPILVLPIILVFFIARLWNPSMAALIALGGGIGWAFGLGLGAPAPAFALQVPQLIAPTFSLEAMLGLALPLYLVTMTGQNLAGLAVLKAANYNPAPGELVAVTGFFSLLSAPFGAHTTNLSAITAAICTGPDAHPDHEKRWITGPWYALFYVLIAIGGGYCVSVLTGLPKSLVALVAGLALLAPLANALTIALSKESERIAAIATFTTTVSGIAFFGIGAAFWGLVTGLTVLVFDRLKNSAFKI
jgi:benzoate membrane transport protein